MARPELGTRLYLVEAVEVEKPASFEGDVDKSKSSQLAGFQGKFDALLAAVKQNPLDVLGQDTQGRPKGAAEFLADGRAVIHLFEAADMSTLIHEGWHFFRRIMWEAADLAPIRPSGRSSRPTSLPPRSGRG